MQITVRTTVPVMPTSTKGLQFIKRKITNFNIDFEKQECTPIVLETLFTEQEIEVENDGVIETIVERIELSKSLRNFASAVISGDKVSQLFSMLKKDIASDDVFFQEFMELLNDTLLLDTQGFLNKEQPMYQVQADEWIKDTPHVLVNRFTVVDNQVKAD